MRSQTQAEADEGRARALEVTNCDVHVLINPLAANTAPPLADPRRFFFRNSDAGSYATIYNHPTSHGLRRAPKVDTAEMTAIHLEVTYEDGLPSVAYLYLPRHGNEKSDHCVQVEPDLVLDINTDGKLIGIEILSPELVTLEAINSVLERYGLLPLGEDVLKPLVVT